MANTRVKRAKLNILVSVACQIISLICGIILPKILLGAYGSEAYGATSSITHFLAYITLLEGGISGVARAALYKPLAEGDSYGVSAVVDEIKKYFRLLAFAFIAYVLVLACSFKAISRVEVLDWASTFLLVIVISISTFGQYFIGISNTILLQAAQQKYITYFITIVAVGLNTVLSYVLVKMRWGLISVKLVSSLVFVLRPIALWLYVKRNFKLIKVKKSSNNVLSQKWTALGQHIAYFLHSNTDVAVLTVLADLVTVSVYSVYNMITSQIQNLATSFTAGMEAVFGDMMARREDEKLHKAFEYYETMISMISVVMFSVTSILIVPFVNLYTANIKDANYIQPLFATLIVFSSFVYCLRLPYHYVVIAAGHFKQTKVAAYGEALINVLLSIMMVYKFGLVGVAVGTVAANLYRFVFYVKYLSNHILMRPIRLCMRREVINCIDVAMVYVIGKVIISNVRIDNYFMWIVNGVVISLIGVLVVVVSNLLFYRDDFYEVLRKVIKR